MVIRYLNWYWYVINDKKGIRGGIYPVIHRYAKTNNKYIKDNDKRELHILNIGM